MKLLIRICITLIIISVSYSQVESHGFYRGFKNIKLIGLIIGKNDIITRDEADIIIKSIGIKTLPNYLYFSGDIWPNNIDISGQPFLTIDVVTIKSKINQNKYTGRVDIALNGWANSKMIEYTQERPPSELTEKMKDKWEDKQFWINRVVSYDIIHKGTVFAYYDKYEIKEIVREFIQEIFDELNILIRDYP